MTDRPTDGAWLSTPAHWIVTALAELEGVETNDENNCLKAARGALDKALAMLATPPPAVAREPSKQQRLAEAWNVHQETLEERMKADPGGVRSMGEEMWLTWDHWVAAWRLAEAAHGIQTGEKT